MNEPYVLVQAGSHGFRIFFHEERLRESLHRFNQHGGVVHQRGWCKRCTQNFDNALRGVREYGNQGNGIYWTLGAQLDAPDYIQAAAFAEPLRLYQVQNLIAIFHHSLHQRTGRRLSPGESMDFHLGRDRGKHDDIAFWENLGLLYRHSNPYACFEHEDCRNDEGLGVACRNARLSLNHSYDEARAAPIGSARASS